MPNYKISFRGTIAEAIDRTAKGKADCCNHEGISVHCWLSDDNPMRIIETDNPRGMRIHAVVSSIHSSTEVEFSTIINGESLSPFMSEVADQAVKMWRDAHPQVVKSLRELDTYLAATIIREAEDIMRQDSSIGMLEARAKAAVNHGYALKREDR